MSDKSQVKVYLPEELHNLLNADSRSNSEAVEAALWAEYGGQKKAAIEVRLDNKRTELEAAKGTLEDEQKNVAELRQEVAKLEQMVDTVEDQEAQRIEDIDELLDEMRETGRHVWEDSGPVQRIATDHYQGDTSDTFEAIKERCEERGLEIPEQQFEEPRGY